MDKAKQAAYTVVTRLAIVPYGPQISLSLRAGLTWYVMGFVAGASVVGLVKALW
jgi:hypothetical protein